MDEQAAPPMPSGGSVAVHVVVNGERHALAVSPLRRLSTVLRDDLGLTGTKVGCGEGACGACAVLVAGVPHVSCLLPIAAVGDREVTTIEGLSGKRLTPLQEAFLAEDALQCGFCTPGQIVSSTALLRETPNPTRGEIRAALSGNLCRCGAYPKIERAIARASGSPS